MIEEDKRGKMKNRKMIEKSLLSRNSFKSLTNRSSGNSSSRGSIKNARELKMIDNNEVIFDSRGNPIVLKDNRDFMNLATKAKKGKFKKQLYEQIPIKIDDQTNIE